MVYLIASELLDIIWLILWILGIEHLEGGAPWSHGLFMALIWSVVSCLIISAIYRNIKAGLAAGIVTFSHWILDVITHPMAAVFDMEPTEPDLFLMFRNSPTIGFGLYNNSKAIAYVFEALLLVLGIASYILFRKRITNKNYLN